MSKTRKNSVTPSPSPTRRKTSDALEIIDETIVGDDEGFRQLIEEETANALLAQAIYDIRTQSGLTQSELAERIGSTQPVISQLEDADYDGHSLSMLRRIADALNQRIEIRFVPREQQIA